MLPHLRWSLPVLLPFLFACAPALSAQDDLPDGKGRETLENTCTECHGLDKALDRLRSARQWRAVAVRMRSKGATMSDDELETLVAYLSQNFGAPELPESREPESRPAAKINVNRASAKEMETALRLTASDAQAIVRYRESRGPYKEWRDLTKVEGLDKAKIEAIKDRIVF